MFAKKKIQLVMFLFVSYILFATHYFLLSGGITGGITIFVDIVYLILMYCFEKYNLTKLNLPLTIASIVATIIIEIFSWQGYISIFPILSMTVYFSSMIFSNIVVNKMGGFVRNVLNIVYMILIKSYLGGGLEAVLMLSALVGAYLSYKQFKKEKVEPLKVENTENADEADNNK